MPRKATIQTAEGKKRPTKLDLSKNGKVDKQKLNSIERGTMKLRIDERTTILVAPEKCTPEYAEQYRLRTKIA